MLSLTRHQALTLTHLQAAARATFRARSDHRLGDGPALVRLATLTDSDATDEHPGLIAHAGGPLTLALIASLHYLANDHDGDASRAAIIILPDGTTLNAPYELTGRITVTAPFTPGPDDGLPPTDYEVRATLAPTLAQELTEAANVLWHDIRSDEPNPATHTHQLP